MNGIHGGRNGTFSSASRNISPVRRACRRLPHNISTIVKTTYATPPYPAGTAANVLANYPLSAFASPLLAWDRARTDTNICSQRRVDKILAPQIPLYTYEFDDQTAPLYFPKMPGFLSLAYHTSDIQYLFPLWHGGPAPPSV